MEMYGHRILLILICNYLLMLHYCLQSTLVPLTDIKGPVTNSRSTYEDPMHWTSRWRWAVRIPVWQRWWVCRGHGLQGGSAGIPAHSSMPPWSRTGWLSFQPKRKPKVIWREMEKVWSFETFFGRLPRKPPESLKNIFSVTFRACLYRLCVK